MKALRAMAAGCNARTALRTYASIGLETEVLSASPQHLITLLFNGALAAIRAARLHMQNNDIAQRGLAISKAISIVDAGLKSSVDLEAGGELATNLTLVYELVVRNLVYANLAADIEKLNLAEQLLKDVSQAWMTSVDDAAQPSTGGCSVDAKVVR